MLPFTPKKMLLLAGFAALAVVVLYAFSLLGVSKQPQTPVEAAEQAGKVSEGAGVTDQPQATEQAKPSLPQGVAQAICEKYADLPEDIVPCQPALDFVIQNYVSDISSFGLMAETTDGTIRPFVAGQPIAEGARLMWLASSYQSGAVLLDAKDLSVIKEKT